MCVCVHMELYPALQIQMPSPTCVSWAPSTETAAEGALVHSTRTVHQTGCRIAKRLDVGLVRHRAVSAKMCMQACARCMKLESISCHRVHGRPARRGFIVVHFPEKGLHHMTTETGSQDLLPTLGERFRKLLGQTCKLSCRGSRLVAIPAGL